MRSEDIIPIVIDCLNKFLNDTENEGLNEVKSNAPVDGSTKLIGKDAVVESIGLVSLIADVEEAVEDLFGIAITIVDERAMSREKSPFIDVKSLSVYVLELIDEAA